MFGINRKDFPKDLPREQRLAYRAALNFYELATSQLPYANQRIESLRKSASYLRAAGDEERAKLVEKELDECLAL